MTLGGVSAEPLVVASQVEKTYGAGGQALHVVREVSCQIRSGELVLLVGPSGSGKTTLISMLGALLRPSSGRIDLCGHPVSQYTEERAARVRREHVGFVFQGYKLFPALTALDNVAEVLVLRGLVREAARERAREALAAVGLLARLGHRPHQLSGGQQQRVAVARALASKPSLIIGDEVTAALDSTTALEVVELLKGHVGEGRAVLLVTHDHRLERFADRVLPLVDGRLLESPSTVVREATGQAHV